MRPNYTLLQSKCPEAQEPGFWVFVAAVLLSWCALVVICFWLEPLLGLASIVGLCLFMWRFEPDKVWRKLKGR